MPSSFRPVLVVVAALALGPLAGGPAIGQTVNLGPSDNEQGGAVEQLNFLFSLQGT